MMMRGPIRDVIPLAGQAVSVALPMGKSTAKVRLLVCGEAVHPVINEGRVEIAMPPIGSNEVVLIEFGS